MKKAKLWRGLTSLTCVLLAFLLVMTNVAWNFESLINSVLNVETRVAVANDSGVVTDTAYYKSDYGDVGKLTREDLAQLNAAEDAFIVREMEEGAVLLKNDNGALPLAAEERRVTLFGNASAKPLYHNNSGGGDNDPTREISFYQALKDDGFSVNGTLYNAYLNSTSTPRSMGQYGGAGELSRGEEPISFYTDQIKNSFADYCDVAIVVITREAGEDNDLPLNDSEGISFLALHQDEKDLLNMIYQSGQFGKIILINNSPNAMEMGWLDEYHIDACLWIGNPGLVGFRGVVNLLTGAANPSGKLVNTYATDSLSSPAVQNMGDTSYANADEVDAFCADGTAGVTNYVVYAEGIYVGYKYYETRYEDCVLGQGNADGNAGIFASEGNWNYADEVVYPFGYGLSYTTFEQTLDSVTEDGGIITVKATVTNTGSLAGKSVVEVYAQTPYTDYDRQNLVEKSSVQLAGYGKTGLLEPGASATVTVTIDKYLLASYDYIGAKGYILDAGDYFISIGNDVHDALNNILAAKGAVNLVDHEGNSVSGDGAKTYRWTQSHLDTETYRYSAETGTEVTNQLANVDLNYWIEHGITYLTRQDWQGTFPKTLKGIAATDPMIKEIDGYTYETPADTPSISTFTMGADNGISFINMKDEAYDSPVWDDFLDQLTLDDMVSIIDETWSSPAVDSVNKPASRNQDGPGGVSGPYFPGEGGGESSNGKATGAIPSAYVGQAVAAATWNLDMIAQRGDFLAEDAIFAGVSHLWAPGGNIHRTPFSGRNFEYYSEDPVMAYLCASAEIVPMQAKGLCASIKHFVGNDQETNRAGISTFMTEQAAREVYLKVFEGAFTKGGALGTMTSYNRMGCTYVGHSAALQKDIMRGEWGFKGVIISDAAMHDYQHAIEGLVGGNDFWCISSIYPMMTGKDLRGVELKKYIEANDDGYLLGLLREANHNFYYAFVRTNLINGLDSATSFVSVYPWWKTTLIAADCVLGVLTLVCGAVYVTGLVKGRKQGVVQ